MPRKTSVGDAPSGTSVACFNEAAARCRGKPARPGKDEPHQSAASMRPRPDAAENHQNLPVALRVFPPLQ